MPFAQLVIGPPGSGKTTYCNGMQQFLTAVGRKTVVVNLDPANDILPYDCGIDLTELVDLKKVMETKKLGPNGGLMFCMEYLEANFDWLEEKLSHVEKDHYLIFDCPGQVELYTHHDSTRNVVKRLQGKRYMITAVHLVDSFYCSQASTYVSAVLTSLATMIKLELPHVNVLSKIDLIESMGELDFNLEFYTDVLDLEELVEELDEDPHTRHMQRLNRAIAGLVRDYSLVSFHTLNIQDKHSVYELMKAIDKSNGYVYGALSECNESIMAVAHSEQPQSMRVGDVQEHYVSSRDA